MDIIKLLLNANADPNIQSKNIVLSNGGKTLMNYTALMSYVYGYECIVSFVYNINKEERSNRVLKAIETIVEEGGYDLYIRNANNETAYDMAVEFKLDAVINCLKPLMEFYALKTSSKVEALYSDTLPLKTRQSIFCWFLSKTLRDKEGNNPDLETLSKIYNQSLKSLAYKNVFTDISESCSKKKLGDLICHCERGRFKNFDINIKY